MWIKKSYRFLLVLMLFAMGAKAQIQFIPNLGQWPGEFETKLRLKYGNVYYSKGFVRYQLNRAADVNAVYGNEAHHHVGELQSEIKQHVFDQVWIGAQTENVVGTGKQKHYQNYFLGKNPEHWRGRVPVYDSLVYDEVYKGIDIHYFQSEDQLKYNWFIESGADPSLIKWQYKGADSAWISENKIIIQTSVGFITEEIPAAYTISAGIKTRVDVNFKSEGDIFSFIIGPYNKNQLLIIDPVVVFASFSGSLADNWGFTATYDADGNLYGGGIVLAQGYPTTTGSFQTNHANPTGTGPTAVYGIDVGISKFNAQGTNLIYSTYLGGNSQDQPHSMYVDAQGDLYVFGVTGSSNFPIPSTGYDATFNGGDSINLNGYRFGAGTDMYVVKFNPAGSSLLAGTYLGGTNNDGLNLKIVKNYADQSRGEIVIGDDNQVYITASTESSNFPIVNGTQAFGGDQDAVVIKLNNSLSGISWSTFYGGAEDDSGYGIKVGTNGSVYITGSTNGSTLPISSGGVNSVYQGGTHDGYIARFNQNTGALQGATYVGTNSYDQTFLLDLDKFNNVYVLGQTGGNYPVTPGKYNNANAKQFIHKFNATLTNSIFSTRFGRGSNTIDIVPIALNIDDCLNILLSGWGGETNDGSSLLGGRTFNMPITADAAQSNTDGSDLYFAVFAPNADSLKYATYFGGGTSREHVDGGTSRFDPKGNIYQAVCAGCGGYSDFPTTPGAWSNTNNSQVPSGNCNLGVVKINFETSITAAAIVDTNIALDTNCNSLTVHFLNQSRNANTYVWDFGDGQTSNLKDPSVTFNALGEYTITLVAIDTICDISDTISLIINHDRGTRPKARFVPTYTSCDVFRNVSITNNTINANQYFWDFGDGYTTNIKDPSHNYVNQGVYVVTLIAVDTTCGASDTATAIIDFTNNIPAPQVFISPDSCFYGGVEVRYINDSAWYTYEWNFGGQVINEQYPNFRYRKSGNYQFSLIIRDTICNTEYTFNFDEDILRIEDRVFIPNAFTPNRDLINEEFIIAGNKCLGGAKFQIFDSVGNIVFETDQPFGEFWNGFVDGKPAQEDVYVYYFKSDDFEKRGYITVFY